MWMPQHTTTLYLVLQPQDLSMVLTSPTFNASLETTLGRIAPTIIALTAAEQLQDTTNWSVQNRSIGYAEKKDILLPTALLMMTGMTMMSLRTRDMLETELVTQGNEGGSVTIFPYFLSFPYGLIISPSTYGHNITQISM